MSDQMPELPSASEWLRWGVSNPEELHAGKQSRVLAAIFDGQKAAVKLTDRHLTDATVLRERVQAVQALADLHPGVVAPLRIAGELTQPIGDWLMTATPFVTGDALDLSNLDDVHLMGKTLAHLHQALASLPPHDIPPVAALASVRSDGDESAWQLLHGDFSDQNLIVTPAGLRIFDLDDCGYGPVEYDVANSLYMVLFDSFVKRHSSLYEAFRPSFLDGYALGAARRVDIEAVDDMVATRITALSNWLDNLSEAPIGIRTSSPEWQEKLRSFVRSYDLATDE